MTPRVTSPDRCPVRVLSREERLVVPDSGIPTHLKPGSEIDLALKAVLTRYDRPCRQDY
jgi:hypothetical protein